MEIRGGISGIHEMPGRILREISRPKASFSPRLPCYDGSVRFCMGRREDWVR